MLIILWLYQPPVKSFCPNFGLQREFHWHSITLRAINRGEYFHCNPSSASGNQWITIIDDRTNEIGV
ncbi:hypothetical protein HC928_16755 [bacterium]|nr:hypothetical protein [bacterium]